jgi:hypothetical protein
MGFMSPELPDVEHKSWPTLPRATRLQVVTRHWAEHGFGTPYAVYLLYLMKIALYVAAPAAIISLTPGLGGLSHIADWWTQPIVYQKVIIFTLLFEVLGLGCGSGPLTGRFMPPIGGVLYWLRPNTIRLPAWGDKVPFTRGDSRTIVDVALYAVVLIGGFWALLSPGRGGPVTTTGDVGLINPVLVIPTIVALALLGLRDKTIFLAARGEHYWLKLFVFFFPFADQIAAFKIIMLCLWWGAATSKLNHHFPYVVSVMTSNNALLRSRLFNPIKHLLYRDHVNDLRPTLLPKLMAHVGGTTAELIVPTILVFVAGDQPWRWFLIGFMVIFHLNILSNLPMGVPLEWNVFFIFSLFYLFGHYGAIRVTAAAGHSDRRGGRRDRGKPFPRKDFVPAGDALLRRQLGHQPVVLPRRRRGEDGGQHRQKLCTRRQSTGQDVRRGHRRNHGRQGGRVPGDAHAWPGAQRSAAAGDR